jgi:hypothetical protein
MKISCAWLLQFSFGLQIVEVAPSSPPYRRMLFPLSTPAPELRRVISKYLAPTSIILATLRESFTSGDQVKLAHRMRESIEEGAPWALARNVGRKIWGLLSGEGEG